VLNKSEVSETIEKSSGSICEKCLHTSCIAHNARDPLDTEDQLIYEECLEYHNIDPTGKLYFHYTLKRWAWLTIKRIFFELNRLLEIRL